MYICCLRMEPIEVEVSQKGKGKVHHVWTALEDEKLVEALVQLHHKGSPTSKRVEK